MVYRVADIEQLLYQSFPATDAFPDDRHGLLVGDPQAEVKGIAIALDATISLIRQARERHCNVLVTHHPVFWQAPDSFLAVPSPGLSSGAAVFVAAQAGVALIGMHTNVDCSPRTAEMLLRPVGFRYFAPLLPLERRKSQFPGAEESQAVGNPVASLGQIGVPDDGRTITLDELARRYRQAFGQIVRIWGEREKPVAKIATCSGSGGDPLTNVLNSGADCYITGELRYHEALELTEAGVALIELGHDVSELPYRDYLLSALLQSDVPAESMVVLGPAASWW